MHKMESNASDQIGELPTEVKDGKAYRRDCNYTWKGEPTRSRANHIHDNDNGADQYTGERHTVSMIYCHRTETY